MPLRSASFVNTNLLRLILTKSHPTAPSSHHQFATHTQPNMTFNAATSPPTFESIGIKNTAINTAPDVTLSSHQKVLVGSILDLFEGRPSLRHLSLWNRTATFADPLTDAQGFDRFAAQWYGLPTVFRDIHLVSHRVVSAANPLDIELRNRYTAKGINKTKEIASLVQVFVDGDGKIERVVDRWDGKGLPEGFVGEAFRKLNAVTVPLMVKVPKNEEEDRKMMEERTKAE